MDTIVLRLKISYLEDIKQEITSSESSNIDEEINLINELIRTIDELLFYYDQQLEDQ